jgi:hypothetical protein
MADLEQNTATGPDGVVHQLADGSMTRCGLNAGRWSRAVTGLQRLGLVVFCPACKAATDSPPI